MREEDRSSEEPREGSLPPKAPAYDLRTGEPLADRPDDSFTDLGIWSPDLPGKTPSRPQESPQQLTYEPAESARQPPPLQGPPTSAGRPGRRPPWWSFVLVVLIVGAAAAGAVVAVAARTPRQGSSASTVTIPASGTPGTASPVTPRKTVESQRPAPPSRGALPGPQPSPGTYRVLEPADASAVQLTGGPSRSPQAFGVRGQVLAGTYLRLICTAYGEPVTEQGGTSRLWDATDQGWISDLLLETKQRGAAAPACAGNVHNPIPGGNDGAATSGPFAVIADGTLDIRSGPDASSSRTSSLVDGDLVLLYCSTRTGQPVPPPQRLSGAGGNDQWDRLQSPSTGWIPDSNVDSHTNGSAAPSC